MVYLVPPTFYISFVVVETVPPVGIYGFSILSYHKYIRLYT